jgi:hypothetical protein
MQCNLRRYAASDKFAKKGLGGIPGAILAVSILAGAVYATQSLGSFEVGGCTRRSQLTPRTRHVCANDFLFIAWMRGFNP